MFFLIGLLSSVLSDTAPAWGSGARSSGEWRSRRYVADRHRPACVRGRRSTGAVDAFIDSVTSRTADEPGRRRDPLSGDAVATAAAGPSAPRCVRFPVPQLDALSALAAGIWTSPAGVTDADRAATAAVTAEGAGPPVGRAEEGSAGHGAPLREVVVDAVVLHRDVVPERDRAGLPMVSQLVLGHIGLTAQMVEQCVALVGRHPLMHFVKKRLTKASCDRSSDGAARPGARPAAGSYGSARVDRRTCWRTCPCSSRASPSTRRLVVARRAQGCRRPPPYRRTWCRHRTQAPRCAQHRARGGLHAETFRRHASRSRGPAWRHRGELDEAVDRVLVGRRRELVVGQRTPSRESPRAGVRSDVGRETAAPCTRAMPDRARRTSRRRGARADRRR